MSETGTFSTLTDVAVMQPARADLVIRAEYVNYAYGSGETQDPGPFRQQPRDQQGRGRDHDGPVGLGKIDLADPDRRPAANAGGKP